MALGRLGGKAPGAPKGFATLSPEERKAAAQKAAKARWGVKKKKGAQMLKRLVAGFIDRLGGADDDARFFDPRDA